MNIFSATPVLTLVLLVSGCGGTASHSSNALENNVNNVMTDIMCESIGADVAISLRFRFDSVVSSPNVPLEDNSVASGEITLEDVFRFYPVAYNIATGYVSSELLKSIMEQSHKSVFSSDIFD